MRPADRLHINVLLSTVSYFFLIFFLHINYIPKKRLVLASRLSISINPLRIKARLIQREARLRFTHPLRSHAIQFGSIVVIVIQKMVQQYFF